MIATVKPRLTLFGLCLGALLLQYCANSNVPLTGGSKDTLAPYVTLGIPANQTTNYRGKGVVLEFNEWIKDKNLAKELLINPPTRFRTKLKRNRLEVIFDDTLRPNTTYNLNFRNGVADLNEGNAALGDTARRTPLRWAFSTGAQIDTLRVAGEVVDLLDKSPAKEVLVSLYPAGDTLRVDKHRPAYFTLTDDKGRFLIENIRAGAYRVYALDDKNGSFSYQEPEAIAFLPDSILLYDNSITLSNLRLALAREDHAPPKLTQARVLDARYLIDFDEGLAWADFKIIAPSEVKEALAFQSNDNGKTWTLYNTPQRFDSLTVEVTATDSAGNTLKKDLKIGFKKSENTNNVPTNSRRRRGNNTNGVDAALKLRSGTGIERDLLLDIEMPKPVKTVDIAKLRYRLEEDTTRLLPLLDSIGAATWNISRTRLSITKAIAGQKYVEVRIDSAAFITVEQDTSRAVSQIFRRKNPNKFGSITGEVATAQAHFILELLNEKGEVWERLRDVRKFEFNFLPAGIYKLRIVIDRNANGRWDTSDVLRNIPPEEILFIELPNGGKLREGWDLQGARISF